ncbi:unnamed protein product, partial [Allacma fusca]
SDVNGGGHELCEDWLQDRQSQEPNEHGSSLNRQEKILLINAYVIKHGLTKSATEDLLTLLQLLSPEDRDIPSSHFLLKKEISVNMNNCKTQFICPKCQSLIGEEKQENYLECESCRTELSNESMLRSGSYFITFDIRYMINSLLQSEEVSACLYRNLLKRNANHQVFQQDICDGESYKTLGLQEFDFSEWQLLSAYMGLQIHSIRI